MPKLLAKKGTTTGLILLAAAAAVQAGPRPGAFSPALAPRAPEVMLYFSHSMNGATSGGTRPTFGLRVQQVRQGANSGDPEAGDPMQHRELLSWQVDARSHFHLSNMQVKLGNHVTYDVSERRFGSPFSRPAIQLGVPSLRNAPTQARPRVSGSLHSAPASAPTETLQAVMESLAPARFVAAQRHVFNKPSGRAPRPATALDLGSRSR